MVDVNVETIGNDCLQGRMKELKSRLVMGLWEGGLQKRDGRVWGLECLLELLISDLTLCLSIGAALISLHFMV